jgi:hypothetical protein
MCFPLINFWYVLSLPLVHFADTPRFHHDEADDRSPIVFGERRSCRNAFVSKQTAPKARNMLASGKRVISPESAGAGLRARPFENMR